MFKYNFNIKYKDVPLSKGIYHIHCPEHIANTHRLGAPFFEITKVSQPVNAQKRTSIHFDCKTLGRNLGVIMRSKEENTSELLFSTKRSDQHLDAFLRLIFTVSGDESSHNLNVSFIFWNPLIMALVPLFPLFVFINGIEDYIFFKTSTKQLKIHPMFALYRLYVHVDSVSK